MVKQKKIVCICIIFALTAALCAPCAFALEDGSMGWTELYFRGPYYCYTEAELVDTTTYEHSFVNRRLTSQTLPFVGQSLSINLNENNSSQIISSSAYYELPMVEATGTPEEYASHFLQRGYTYKGRVYFSLTYMTNSYEGIENVSQSMFPTFSVGISEASSADYALLSGMADGFSYVANINSYNEEQINGRHRLISYIVDFGFHCPEYEENDPSADYYFEDYDALGFYFYYDVSHLVAFFDYCNCAISFTSLTAEYDPDGSEVIVPSDTEQIIDGQLSAVDHQIQQEQTQTNAAAGDALGSGTSAASGVFSNQSFLSSLQLLLSILTSTSTSFNITFPASGNVPFLGQLWSAQVIPLQYWIDQLPAGIKVIMRFLLCFGALGLMLHALRRFIKLFKGGD